MGVYSTISCLQWSLVLKDQVSQPDGEVLSVLESVEEKEQWERGIMVMLLTQHWLLGPDAQGWGICPGPRLRCGFGLWIRPAEALARKAQFYHHVLHGLHYCKVSGKPWWQCEPWSQTAQGDQYQRYCHKIILQNWDQWWQCARILDLLSDLVTRWLSSAVTVSMWRCWRHGLSGVRSLRAKMGLSSDPKLEVLLLLKVIDVCCWKPVGAAHYQVVTTADLQGQTQLGWDCPGGTGDFRLGSARLSRADMVRSLMIEINIGIMWTQAVSQPALLLDQSTPRARQTRPDIQGPGSRH